MDSADSSWTAYWFKLRSAVCVLTQEGGQRGELILKAASLMEVALLLLSPWQLMLNKQLQPQTFSGNLTVCATLLHQTTAGTEAKARGARPRRLGRQVQQTTNQLLGTRLPCRPPNELLTMRRCLCLEPVLACSPNV